MTCEEARTALSARLDGEEAVGPAPDGHVASCAACREWLAGARYVTRLVRVQAGQLTSTVPDLTTRVLAAVAADQPPVPAPAVAAVAVAAAEARGRRQILRLAVGLAAVAQLVLAVPVLLGMAGVVPSAHASREMASFDVAVAVGFALAAYRPQRARVFLPVALVLAACLGVTSAIDLAQGHTFLVHEFGHLAAVAQAGLLWALGRTSEPPHRTGMAAAGPAAQA